MLRLLNFWLAMLIPMFAAAPVVPAGGEAAPVSGGESAAPVEADPATEDTAEIEAPVEGDTQGEIEAEATPEGQQDTRVLTGPMRKVLAELKTTNPEAYKQLKSTIFAEKEFRTMFPQGPQQAREMAAKLDEIGGLEGIEEINTEVQDYRQLDEQFINGDPQFIETAVSNFPDGFKKLMPRMLETYHKVDPDGYNRALSGIIHNTFASSGLNQAISQIKWLLSRTQDDAGKEALAQIAGIEQWVGKFGEIAAKPAVSNGPDPRQQELDQRASTVAQQEQNLFIQGIQSNFDTFEAGEISKELKQYAGTKPVSDYARGVIQRDTRAEIWKILLADKGFVNKYESLCENRDKDGAFKLLRSRSQALIGPAVKKVYRSLYGQAAPPKQQQPAPGANGKPAPAAPKGWTRVAAPPKPDQVASATTMEQKYNSMAILKNGQKVYWGDKVPA